MRKALLAVLLILLVAVSAVYADSSLLKSSILSCTYQELVEIGTAYGLDTQVSENTLRQEILDYFGLDGSEEGESTLQEAKAEDVTSIQIEHSDRMDSVGDLVVLSGGVRVKFTSAQTGERILTANYVAIDLGHKILQASGDVILEDESGTQRTFRGQVVSLDWSSLDVVVFDGISTTTRTNSSGKEILFYVSGNEVSYDGESSGVFFRDGTIATWPDDPYWSISAKKLSLSGNDLFFDRAVFRLGRVPIFYFPVFFYPGTTLSFNPSIGMSSTKGAFMTTTYEVYGQYPRLGVLGTKSSNSNTYTNEVDASDVSGLTSFFDSDDDSTMVHDGLYYRPLKDGEELSPTEKWARESGSYLAVFADVYQNLGLSMGVDTLNKFLDKKLSIGAIGVAAYNPYRYEINMRRFRYSFDFNLDFNKDNLKVTAALPMRSDPAVRVDYLNRNTAFALDSLLGVEQFFPATYKSQSTYTWLVDSSYKMSVGNFNFSISSLKADVDYKLDLVQDEDWNYYYKPTVVEASLPYLNFSSDGVFVNLKGQSKKTTKDIGYSNDLAKSFFEQQAALSEELEDVSEDNANVTGIKPYSGPDLLLEQTSVSQAASLKIGYTYNQTLDNIYKTDLAHDNFYTKINSTVYLDASAPDQWLQVKETLKPQFNYSNTGLSDTEDVKIDEFYLSSSLKASIPKLGITYNLDQKVYNHYYNSKQSTITDRWGEWDSKDVTAHNASISQKVNAFTFGFYAQFKPLTEILKPSLAYSHNGFSASADFSMKRPADADEFEKGEANLNVSYAGTIFSASAFNKYDFSKVKAEGSDPWNGYSLIQKASLKPVKGLTFSETANYSGQFVATSLSVSGTYELDTNVLDLVASSTMKFTGEDYDKDSLNIVLKLSQDQVSLWKKRVAFESAVNFSFNYDFVNPFRTYMTAGLSLTFAVAEFLDLSLSVNSTNKSFSRYYQEDGSFSFSSMLQDLAKSFDFFGTGRTGTGFNLSSFKFSMVHYMRDWNLYIDAQGSLTTQYTGKYEWVPSVTVYVKWNAIPELRTQGSWDAHTKEWT